MGRDTKIVLVYVFLSYIAILEVILYGRYGLSSMAARDQEIVQAFKIESLFDQLVSEVFGVFLVCELTYLQSMASLYGWICVEFYSLCVGMGRFFTYDTNKLFFWVRCTVRLLKYLWIAWNYDYFDKIISWKYFKMIGPDKRLRRVYLVS
jgi:hypothetical protein